MVIVDEKHVEDGLADAKTDRALVALQVLRYCNRDRNSPEADVTLLRSKAVNDKQMNLKLSCRVAERPMSWVTKWRVQVWRCR